jgi:hypothetical protein
MVEATQILRLDFDDPDGRQDEKLKPTTDLSRIADTFVISRNTSFTYRNKRGDTRQR